MSILIRFHYLHSLSEGKGNLYTGLCIGVKKRKSLHCTVMVLCRVAGARTFFSLKMNSPFLVYFKIVKKGSGNLKVQLLVKALF